MPLPLITQIYIVCSAIGSLFLVMCAFMGATHHGGGGHSGSHVSGGGGGHAGIGHGGGGHTAIGHGGSGHTAIGHSAGGGHGTAAGHSAAGSSAAGHSAAGHSGTSSGTHSAGGHGSTNAGANELLQIQSAQLQASTGPFHAPSREEEKGGPVEALLSALNPTILTTFLAFFGLTGLFFISSFPILGWTTLVPAFIGGFVSVKVVTSVMNAAFARMFSSSAATENDLIGHMAEVTVPITIGRTGEVTYIVSSKRYTSPARARNPELEIPKGTKVIIYDHPEKYVLVELWTDSFIDPAFDDDTLTPQEKLAKKRSENLH